MCSGIGEFGDKGRLEGYIDELYIYNKTLTEPELNALIQKCQGPQSTMVLHLSFDKKSGTKFLDDSGLMNHATMGGPPLQPGLPTPAPPPRKFCHNWPCSWHVLKNLAKESFKVTLEKVRIKRKGVDTSG